MFYIIYEVCFVACCGADYLKWLCIDASRGGSVVVCICIYIGGVFDVQMCAYMRGWSMLLHISIDYSGVMIHLVGLYLFDCTVSFWRAYSFNIIHKLCQQS